MKKPFLLAFSSFLGFSAAFTSIYSTEIPTPSIYQNPYMASNNFSEVHANSYQTDTSSIRGPGKSDADELTEDALLDSPAVGSGTLGFDNAGRVVMLRTKDVLSVPIQPYETDLLLIDQNSLTILDSVTLPTTAFAVTSSYFYIDNLNRVVVPTPTQAINIYSISSNHFVLDQSYSLVSALNLATDTIISVVPDSAGNLWFASQFGTVGYVNPTSGQVFSSNLASVTGGSASERITKSFATDESGGVFIVSNAALYRFQVGTSGTPIGTWRTTYNSGTRLKSGQFQQGSGTTPTLFNDFAGNKFVTIADNADPYMNVVVFNRTTGALVVQQPVFTKFPYATSCENSLIAVGGSSGGTVSSIIIENNYGTTGAGFATTTGTNTSVPGLARVDFDSVAGTSEVVWTNYHISIPSAVSRLSTKNGLIYTYAKDKKSWYFATVDFFSGEVKSKVRVPTTGILAGDLANNFFSGVGIGPDKSAYVPTIGGITVWRHNP